MPKTVCILYGFCEGPQVSKKFTNLLAKRGYTVVSDAASADIIIGHSGGCYLLPEKFKAKQVVQIGIPCWPGRSLPESINRKFWSDLHSHHQEGALHFWAKKTFWNVVYFWNMSANILMLRGRAKGTLWRHGQITTVIRPSLDTFCTSDPQALPFDTPPKFVSIVGHHDECWRKPKLYVDVIQSLHGA